MQIDEGVDSVDPLFHLIDLLRTTIDDPAPLSERYADWASRLMLLATFASYPGDLSRFGACGAISWDPQWSMEGELAKWDDVNALPSPGRSNILFGLDGALRDGMQDKAGECVERWFGERVDGKPQAVVKRSPWRTRGLLGRLVDRLKPVLDELRETMAGAPLAPSAGSGSLFASTATTVERRGMVKKNGRLGRPPVSTGEKRRRRNIIARYKKRRGLSQKDFCEQWRIELDYLKFASPGCECGNAASAMSLQS